MFKDYVKIHIKSGNGGDGHVSFRRELYVPNGGPDGGDGGKGGDIVFEIDDSLNTLSSFYHNKKYIATDGENGKKRKCHGKDGQDKIIKVPRGTIIRDALSNKIIADMSEHNTRQIILKGGKGGIGNMHYATSTMQAPRYAKPGGASIELDIILELKLIGDVGIIGFPNAGKSTLLSVSSSAKVEIADYPFTTITPHLGVVNLKDNISFVMVDIPGLIEGASSGKGLGFTFLRHIERNKLLIHLVDLSTSAVCPFEEAIDKINNELSSYSNNLLKIPQIIVGNKIDSSTKELTDSFEQYCKDKNYDYYLISAASQKNVQSLLEMVYKKLNSLKKDDVIFASEYDPNINNNPVELDINVYKKKNIYYIEGSRVEKMLGYTNLESEKGFVFFQNFIKEQKIEDKLKELGICDGDTVNVLGWEFEFYE